MADVTTPETPSERFKRRMASSSLLDRILSGGFAAEKSGERPDLANPAEQKRVTRLADVTPRPLIPAEEDSPSQGLMAHQRIESTLLAWLDLMRHQEQVAEAEREKRMRFYTPSQWLKVH
jgi:hypothetical protein